MNKELTGTIEYKDGKLVGLDEGGKNTIELLLDYIPEELHERAINNFVRNAQIPKLSYEHVVVEYDETDK
jgi:hypothetical protein